MRLLVVGMLTLLAGSAHADEAMLRRALGRYAAADFQGSIRILLQASRRASEAALLGKIQLYLGVNHEVLNEVERAKEAFRAALTHQPGLVLDPKRFRASALALFSRVKASIAVPPASQPVGDRPARDPPPRSAQDPPASRPLAIRTPAWPARQRRSDRRVATAVSVQDRPSHRRRFWTWVAGGCAAAAAAAGLGLGLSAVVDHNEWEQMWEAGVDRDGWVELGRSGERKELAANVLFSVAGALAVGAVIAYLLEGREPSRSPDKPVSFRAGY